MTNTFTLGRGFKALLLAGGASTIVLATPVFAQDDSQAAAPAADTIVVTGSRIAKQDFEANSPIVTVDDKFLKRSSSAALETSLNKLPQFTPAQTPFGGADIQPTATNTPGAATVSLRGLGTNRNLVLIDGRRATPGNASGTVDINTIPSAAIERVEVVTGGASATYGADAMAGVTNFILKKNFQGLEVDSQMGISEHGDGFELQVGGIMGTDFADGRGNVSIALSYNKRNASNQADRSWYRDLWSSPNTGGDEFFIEYPGVVLTVQDLQNDTPPPGGTPSGPLSVTFPGATPSLFGGGPTGIATFLGATLYTDPNHGNAPFTWGFFNNIQQGGLTNFGGFQDDPLRYKRTVDGGAGANWAQYYLSLPLERYNMFMRGNYELNDWIGVFGQGLYSHVETANRNQGGALTSGWDVFVPYGTGTYTGSALGLPVNIAAVGNPASYVNAAGSGNPSSVLFNGMTYSGGVYGGDATPGDLSDNPTNPDFKALYGNSANAALAACANSASGGCTNNQAIGQFLPAAIQTALNARTNPNDPVQLNYGIPEARTVLTDVDTFNITAGFQGSIPGTDWTWELFLNQGESITFAQQTGTYSLTRARSLLQAPGFGLGYVNNSNTASIRQNVVDGVPYGFGSNIATCSTGLNVFAGWNNISGDCKEAIRADLKNRSTTKQTIVEFNAQGKLLDLPAGELRGAIGASYRKNSYKFVNDTLTTQDASFLDQAIGIYPSIDFDAAIKAKEFYGELAVPVLHDIPGIKEFNLELGGRISDYDTTGTSYTYKIIGDWEVNDWIRLRGGYNRAERAPNIAELFLTPQQTFAFNTVGDICSENSNYFISANPDAPNNTAAQAADVKAVCAAVMNNTGGAGTASSYYSTSRPPNGQVHAGQPAPGGGFSFPTIQGNSNLVPEVADTYTAGIVLSSPFASPLLSRARLTVDWFNVKINHAIGVSPGATLQKCLDPFYNAAVSGASTGTTFDPTTGAALTISSQAQAAATSQACAGATTAFTYDPAPGLGLGRITASYTNEGVADISGLDAQFDWSGDVGPGTVSLNVVGSYYLHYKVKELLNQPLIDYAGTFGTNSLGLQTGAYRYRLLTNLGYRIGGAFINLQWQHLPSVEDSGEAIAPTPNSVGDPKAYDLFGLSGSYSFTDNVTVRAGVDNLFNRAPPLTGYNPNASATTIAGGGYNAGFYDTNGRSFYFGANLKF